MSKKEKTNAEEATMSIQMLSSLKAEIKKFGFATEKYHDFLFSVKAMQKNKTVMMYQNSEMEEYRDRFLKKHEYSLSDCFVLEKFKIKSSEDGRDNFTGWFTPRSFWDYVYRSKVN
jgi:hypothetical protein